VPGRRVSIEEREELSRGLVAKESLCSIARRLGRPASTLSCEVAHNGAMAHYRAARAHPGGPRPRSSADRAPAGSPL